MKIKKVGNFKLLKRWYIKTQPSKLHLSISIISAILANLTWVITPIFAAEVITCITEQMYTEAILNLVYGFLFIVLRQVFWHINYYDYSKLLGIPYKRVNSEIVDKVFTAKSNLINKVSKEKLLSMVHQDAYTMANFSDKLSIALSKFARVSVTIITIFFYNIWCGLIVLLVNIFDYSVLTALNQRKQKHLQDMKENRDIQFKQFGELFDSKDYIEELGAQKKIKKEYLNHIDNYIKITHKNTINSSYQVNIFYAVYQFFIMSITAVLIYFVSQGDLTLTIYMVLVSYITAGIENTSDMLTVISDLRDASVAVNRIEIIKNLPDKEIKKFGNVEYDNIFGLLDFKDVNYKGSKKTYPSLKNISFRIKPNEVTLIYGVRGSGKRTIFNLLRRKITPSSGQIYVDGINLQNYKRTIHNTNFNFTTAKPHFFNGSIMKNLKIVEGNVKKIYSICQQIGLHSQILLLKHGYKTNINDISFEMKYLVAFARTLLTKSEIIALYEFPTSFNNDDLELVKNAIRNIRFSRSVIIFTASNNYFNMADKIIEINNGSIKHISFNNEH